MMDLLGIAVDNQRGNLTVMFNFEYPRAIFTFAFLMGCKN